MKKRIIQAFVASICGSLIAACGTVSKEQRILLEERTRTFTVHSTDSATNTPVSGRDIVSSLAESMYGASRFERVRNFYNNGNYTQGLSVEIDNALNITAYYRDNFQSLSRHMAGTFKVVTTNDGKFIKVQVTCPASIEDYDSYKGGISGRRLFQDKDVSTDLSKICDGLNIGIKRQKYVKSELNTQFPSDSVFANYSRKLKASREPGKVKAYDIEKATLFNFSQGKTNIDVALSVFPYRTGSKVIYGFNFPYVLRGDGTSTFSSEEVTAIEKSMASIAND